jgi:predicted cupin superfamily sugar epimerase
MNDASEWIQALQLERHLAGGWIREVYRAQETIPRQSLPSRFSGDRSFSTAIYFLLRGTDFEALHRLKQDEIWHAYDGAALTIHMIDPAGSYSTVTLGRNVQAGEAPLAVIKAGWLFGATVNDPRSYALVGCTVAPGFDFADFEMPSRTELLEQYPQHRQIIEQLTRQS